MFEGFCPSFANQYIGFNLPISLLCVDVNLGIFLPLPPQHSRLWKKEGVSYSTLNLGDYVYLIFHFVASFSAIQKILKYL